MKIIFEARTPEGVVYRVFEDGSTQGFPDGTVVSNGWMRMINYEKGLRIQAKNKCLVSNEQPANVID
jgi:hypothetical protein